LGYPDADKRQAKLRLAFVLNRVIQEQHLTQAVVSRRLGIKRLNASALKNYKLEGFSVKRLTTFLTLLDRNVEIVIRKKTAMAREWQ
jgi:predicted XRE-type DNA-binding protein